MENNPIRIGGIGHVVEIDETVINRNKYHRGRLVATVACWPRDKRNICGVNNLVLMEILPLRTSLHILKRNINLNNKF
jgi:hypothetical protein